MDIKKIALIVLVAGSLLSIGSGVASAHGIVPAPQGDTSANGNRYLVVT